MFNSIIVPIDLSVAEIGKSLIGVARNLGNKDAKIKLVYIVEDVPAFINSELPSGLLDQKCAEAKDELKAIARASGLKPSDTEVRAGSAATAILTAAKEGDADLIIIGSHKPGLQDYFLGSTASRVVRHAECAVLVVR
jgi:nucleotide-binding universal stress UspA family protein